MASLDLRPPRDAVARPASSARSLLDVFDATLAAHPGRVALDTGTTRLTYAGLAAAADDVARRLRAAGVGCGDRVGVRIASGTAELYVAILGVLRAGAAYVPADADDPPTRTAAILDAAAACAVLEDDLRLVPLLPAVGGGAPAGTEADAWIIFTSGSSGVPKGVAVSHRAAASFVDAEALLWAVTPEDRVLAGLSVAFDASCEEMWLAWRNGAALVPAPRAVVRAGADLGPWLATRGVTVVSTVPTLAALWDDDALRGVRLLILGGEACPPELGWRLAGAREVWNTYGPTEATVVTTATRITPGRPVTIGWPLAGRQVAVVDEAGEPVAFGDPGELVIAGAGLGRYVDPHLDAERYAALPTRGWARAYRSGDVVRETIDGLQFVGRRDDQVKLGGRRLELGEVEAQLRAVPGVAAAAAAVRMTAQGDGILVGYVVGDVMPAAVRAAVARQLPDGVAPVVVVLDALPPATSGKLDRSALPWPPPGDEVAGGRHLTATETWLALRWRDQLGPVTVGAESDFFDLGGTSVAVARLVSALRRRFPAVAVADVYEHRTLAALATRLDALGERGAATAAPEADRRQLWSLLQLVGVAALLTFVAGEWLIGVLVYDATTENVLPHLGWPVLAAAWLLLSSPLSRSSAALGARHLLVPRLAPGRYPRYGSLALRLWFLERLGQVCRIGRLAGTPWAARYARLCGTVVGEGARLGTIPPPGALVTIGAGATIEAGADLNGWWIDGHELVVGRVVVGAGARIGTRAMLLPGAVVGDGAEIDPGSVVSGPVPPGERWAGSPARRVGLAGESWPDAAAPAPSHARAWRAAFAAGLLAESLLPLVAAGPPILACAALGFGIASLHAGIGAIALEALVLTATYVVSYAALVAGVVRLNGRLLRPGWHADEGATGWALWFGEGVMGTARAVLFPLMCSIYTRPWLRLAGIEVGRRTEISTVVGLNRLTAFGARSFAADDVVLAVGRARGGWLHVAPITIGSDTFLGNTAMLGPGTKVGDGCLVGVLTAAPAHVPDGTSWLGSPAIELPRVADAGDPRRTTHPPRRLVLGRSLMDLLRILLPSTTAVLLGFGTVLALEAIGGAAGLLVMVLAAPLVLLAAGLAATALTIALKWLVIGRYARGEHPLWSLFVWRDELINSAQEQLAGAWLMSFSIGTPLMSAYLRAMGARVGRNVWCETLALTEFDLVALEDGAVVNRHAVVETHLFHDRILRIGSSRLGRGATLGPGSAVLPDTILGDGCVVGGNSVVLRGEELPAGTRWHGSPVVGM
ncbi:MAG: hypothetical protein QOD24_4526 [Solirubrobacteraceae bacterium]|nr:hypothetical protein [Solirubrobacteraceae bacterium]